MGKTKFIVRIVIIYFVFAKLNFFGQSTIDSLLGVLPKTSDNSKKAEIYFKLGRLLLIEKSDFEKALGYYNKAEKYATSSKNDTLFLETLINKYYCFDRLYSTNGVDSNKYLIKKLSTYFPHRNNRLNAKYYVLLGDEETNSDIQKTLEYYLEAKKYFVLAGVKNLFSIDQRLIRVYHRTNQYRKSLTILNPFVEECKAKNLKKELSQVYHYIAVAYYNLENDSCVDCFNKSAEYALNTFGDTALYLSDNVLLIDYLILNKKKFNDAELRLEKCKAIMRVYSKPLDKITISNIFGLSGDLFKNKTTLLSGDLTSTKKNIEKAIYFYQLGLKEFSENEFLINEQTNKEVLYKSISECYSKINQADSALFYYKKSIEIRDSLNSIQSNMDAKDLLAKYDTEKKDYEINLLNEKNKVFYEQSKQNKIVIIGVVVIAILFFISLVIFINRYRLKKNANITLQSQKEIIESSNAVISKTNQELVKRNNLIQESIEYAAIIQQSILQNESVLYNNLKDFFVINIPKEAVGGDFYWVHTSVAGKIYAAVADCTGHGVPGSLMTLLCHNIFNEIIEKHPDIQVNEFLSMANKKIYNSFNTDKTSQKSTNGMNVSMICIDNVNKKMTYSGAKNAVLLVKNRSEVQELKVDLYSIGYLGDYTFSLYETDITASNEIYLTTDGIADQVGGPNNRKFLKSNLMTTIQSIYGISSLQQKTQILSAFNNWKGSNEQKDDVCLLCIKLT